MAKIVQGKKLSVNLITFSKVDSVTGKMVHTPVWVEATTKTTEHFIQGFRSALRTHPEKLNDKMKNLKINLMDLNARMVAPTFSEDANKTVNFYIDKFNTIENGWQTSYKPV